MALKKILACAVLLLAATLPASATEEGPPPPVSVEVVVNPQGTYVLWAPPPLVPDVLVGASYNVYGFIGGTPYLLDTVESPTTTAQVTAGYDTYGVSVVLDADESVIVKAFVSFCVSVNDEFPFVHVDC